MELNDQPVHPCIEAVLTGELRSIRRNFLLLIPRQQILPFETDGPGQLSPSGPRHDNDHVRIQDIQILPTTDEFLQTGRSPWMPEKNVASPHFMPHGTSRHIDIHFRMLRYDAVEKIRDVNYKAAQSTFLPDMNNGPHVTRHEYMETPAGNRFFLYQNSKVEGLIAHEHFGMLLKISFDCPAFLQGHRMRRSARLEQGYLCALVCLDTGSNELAIHYFNVVQKESTFSMPGRQCHTQRASVQLALLPDASNNHISQIMSIAAGTRPAVRMALIEYTSILYASFANPLHCLQKMVENDYSFHEYISPSSGNHFAESGVHVRPPEYAMRPGFKFDLSPLTGRLDSIFTIGDLTGPPLFNVLQHLSTYTTLDAGQVIALVSSLSREFAFTQGPPGTGKTFLSVALTRVLLSSRPEGHKHPVLLVCRTNHALDAFMAGLRDAGVDKLLRIGGASREEWTKSINLREAARHQNYTPQEKSTKNRIEKERIDNWIQLETWSKGISEEMRTGYPFWQHISPMVAAASHKTYAQLVTNIQNPKAQAFIYDYWAKGGDLDTIQSLQEELMHRLKLGSANDDDIAEEKAGKAVQGMLNHISSYTSYQNVVSGENDVWHLPLAMRQALLQDWLEKIDRRKTSSQLQAIYEDAKKFKSASQMINEDKEIRVIRQHNIVGLTTTACAGRWDMLRKVGFEIMICEEAAEVLEAHAICCLFPTLHHAINIGDPLQLRPDVEQHSLTMENPRGKPFRLDESLFERIMQPSDPLTKAVATVKLHVQRRMHPAIAEISRITYPYLQDHPDTALRPLPSGLQSHLWWLDHRVPEDALHDVTKSVSNEYEVQVVKELVAYLLRGSDYSPGDIAILTPYAGQLLRLQDILSQLCSVWVSEQDRDSLVQSGAVDPERCDMDARAKLNLPLKNLLRLATVDNFQGEEAKVVILSTVRSGEKLGFVKSPNRINVACSRARNGFYIVGNAAALNTDPIWHSIIEVFMRQQALQPFIRLQCDRHPEHSQFAISASDIASFSTCGIACGQQRDCGHLCSETCHEPALHRVIPCSEPCQRELPCGHSCKSLCGETCRPCQVQSRQHKGACGHVLLVSCTGEIEPCDQFSHKVDRSCGRHSVRVTCGGEEPSSFCDATCDLGLSCNHNCTGVCGHCLATEFHTTCTSKCHKGLPCGHQCDSVCHNGIQCPPCERVCQSACTHTTLTRKCSDAISPCLQLISLGTGNSILNTICAMTELDTISSEVQMCDSQHAAQSLHLIVEKFIDQTQELLSKTEREAILLGQSHHLFLIMLEPRTLAAARNVQGILQRHESLLSIKEDATRLRTSLQGFHAGVDFLANSASEQVLVIPPQLGPKIDMLLLRLDLVKLQDTFKTVTYLLTTMDHSQQMYRSALELISFTKVELMDILGNYEGRDNGYLDDVMKEYRDLLNNVNSILPA